MSFSLGGNKQKQTTNQTQSSTSTFTPNQQFLDMTQNGLSSALGLMGSYGTTGQADVANYLNPMQDTINAQIRRSGSIAANNNDAQAAAAGAFGGSGWGLLRGETARAYADAEANAAAQGYNTALQAAMQERGASNAYDLNALQTYLSGLGLLGNWGATTSNGTSSGSTTGRSSNYGINFAYGGK